MKRTRRRTQARPTAGCLVSAFDQAAGDDHGLNLAGTFENVQDTGILKDAADRVFERKAIAAMDLDGIVGGGPGIRGYPDVPGLRL